MLRSWHNEDIIIKKLGDDSLKINSLVARCMSGPIRKRLKQLKQKEIKKARLKRIKNLEHFGIKRWKTNGGSPNKTIIRRK